MIPRALFIATILLHTGAVFAASFDHKCGLCGKAISGDGPRYTVFSKSEIVIGYVKSGAISPSQAHTKFLNDIDSGVYVHLCDTCNNLYKFCSVCGLPVPDDTMRTGDGRLICAREASDVLMDAVTADKIFQSAQREAVNLINNSFGLNQSDVTVRVADNLSTTRFIFSGDTHVLAISETQTSRKGVTHRVFVRTGQTKQQAFYSCIHEYTHLWINENVGNHDIEPNTIEGICELIAYKVAERRSDSVAQKIMLHNTYTHGRLQDLIQYNTREMLSKVLDWVRDGTTYKLPKPDVPLDIQIALAQAATRPQKQVETLSVNGTIHTAKGTLVLLTSGLILGKGESGMIKINGQSSKIRCLDIKSDTAVLQFENSTNLINLTLQRH